MSELLTDNDIEAIRSFLCEMDDMDKREPEKLPAETWDAIWPQLQQGIIPAEYNDRISKSDKGYYDVAWERWNEECYQIQAKYHGVIIKALRYALSNEQAGAGVRPVMELLQALISDAGSITPEQEKASPRSAAIEKGALMTIGGRIASYSTNNLKDALNACSIYRLPSNVDLKQAFDDTGKLNALTLQDKPLEGLPRIHTAFLMAIVQAVELVQIDDGDNTISFYLPAMCRELRIDPRTYSSKRKAGQDYAEMRLAAMLEIITPFDPFVGHTPDGNFYRVLTFVSYDKVSEIMTISTPYLFRLKAIKAIAEQRATGQKHPQLNRLMHSSAVNEPNRAAVELANRILTGIVTRGVRADYRTYNAEPKKAATFTRTTSKDGQRTTTTTTTTVYDTGSQTDDTPAPSKTVTYKVKYQTLIDDCPQLKNELDEIINGKGKAEREAEEHNASAEEIKKAREKDKKTIPQRVNKKLKDVFTAAFRIIAEKSDAPARYLDFTLPTTTRTVKGKKSKAYDVPTKSTLARYMVITHRGRNPRYTE